MLDEQAVEIGILLDKIEKLNEAHNLIMDLAGFLWPRTSST